MSDVQFAILVAFNAAGILAGAASFRVVRGYLRGAAEVLALSKEYYEMGRAQHKDAAAVMCRVDQRMEEVPAAKAAVAEAVAEVASAVASAVVPLVNQTAERVADAMKDSDPAIPKPAPKPQGT